MTATETTIDTETVHLPEVIADFRQIEEVMSILPLATHVHPRRSGVNLVTGEMIEAAVIGEIGIGTAGMIIIRVAEGGEEGAMVADLEDRLEKDEMTGGRMTHTTTQAQDEVKILS